MTFIKDDMMFLPYMQKKNEYQCKMSTIKGVVSVRMGDSVITDNERPYEVWYPTESDPTPYQTADDVWNYILQKCPD